MYYGGHHHESYYTHFFQSYYLPHKFNIDKRKTEYSAFIRTGQMTREEALKEINENSYPYDKELVDYVISKLGIDKKEFDEIFSSLNRLKILLHPVEDSTRDYQDIAMFPWPSRP